MDNLPILYKNIIYGLPSPFAVDCFLWATDRPGNDRMCYSAENFAREADALFSAESDLGKMLDMAQRIFNEKRVMMGDQLRLTDEAKEDLRQFLQKRHANYRLGNNCPQPPAAPQIGGDA